jgi:hypothetical protein
MDKTLRESPMRMLVPFLSYDSLIPKTRIIIVWNDGVSAFEINPYKMLF